MAAMRASRLAEEAELYGRTVPEYRAGAVERSERRRLLELQKDIDLAKEPHADTDR